MRKPLAIFAVSKILDSKSTTFYKSGSIECHVLNTDLLQDSGKSAIPCCVLIYPYLDNNDLLIWISFVHPILMGDLASTRFAVRK